uniref:Uncharacterized protein n=1 Tax=Bigelowiella natans TaxID=227086 RepID=A0A7S2P6F1_BIGNA
MAIAAMAFSGSRSRVSAGIRATSRASVVAPHTRTAGIVFNHSPPPRCATATPRRSVYNRDVSANFKFLKDMGLKKPDFLPDFGGPKKARLAEEFVASGFPESGRAESFTASVGGKTVTTAELQAALQGASDFEAQPYDEVTLERIINFKANGKPAELKMTQEGKVLSVSL